MQALKLGTLMVALALVLSGCSFPKTPEARARLFFDKGQDVIMDSLEDQHLTDQQLQQARDIMKRRRPAVISAVANAFRAQQNTFQSIYAGEGEAGLTAQGARLHQAQQTAFQTIGAMHEALAQAVGRKAWNAASAERRESFRDRFE